MNERIKQTIDFIPLMTDLTDVDAAIAVWNTDGVVEAFFGSNKSTIRFEIGDRIEDKNDKIFEVFRTGKSMYNKIPKEVFGEAVEGKIVPIFDGGKVVGAVTYAISSKYKEGIIGKVDELSQSLKETDQSIESIGRNSKELSNNMKEVKNITDEASSSVDEAIEIVKSIQQNAKLSNILALNASIESARAGEAGKGFAVVSDEMRKFSKMSAEASEKISESLKQIEKSLTQVKSSINLSKDIAENQAESVNGLNDLFESLVDKADEAIKVYKELV